MKKPYRIKTRKDSPYFYYKFKYETTFHSTGIINDGTKNSEVEAENFVVSLLQKNDKKDDISLKEYFKKLFYLGRMRLD